MSTLAQGYAQWATLNDGETLVLTADDGDLGVYERFTDQTHTTREGEPVQVTPGTTRVAKDGTADAIFFRTTRGTLNYSKEASGGSGASPPATTSVLGTIKIAGPLGGSASALQVFGYGSTSAFLTDFNAKASAAAVTALTNRVATLESSGGGGGGGDIDGGAFGVASTPGTDIDGGSF